VDKNSKYIMTSKVKNKKIAGRVRRHKKTRSRIMGTSACPRLSVFRSNKHIFLQLIDDISGKTLVSESDMKEKKNGTKIEVAKIAGKKIAEMALAQKIEKIVFDKGGYKYHGRVKAIAEGAREGGLNF